MTFEEGSLRREVEETIIMDSRLRINSADFAMRSIRPLVREEQIRRSPPKQQKNASFAPKPRQGRPQIGGATNQVVMRSSDLSSRIDRNTFGVFVHGKAPAVRKTEKYLPGQVA